MPLFLDVDSRVKFQFTIDFDKLVDTLFSMDLIDEDNKVDLEKLESVLKENEFDHWIHTKIGKEKLGNRLWIFNLPRFINIIKARTYTSSSGM